jgi:type VI secretion system protein ImpC
MRYDVSFGHLPARPRPAPGANFRLAVLGDFSGRASKGQIETGSDLAKRKPLRVEFDTLDDVIARLGPGIVIPLGDEGTIEIPLRCMDDFHPDQLVENLPMFEQMLGLRRNLQSRTIFDRAAREVLGWAGAEPLTAPETRRSRGGVIATDQKLSDFARLVGRPARAEASCDDLVRRLIGPYIVAKTDSRQDALIARVDTALSDAMRRVLHHPEFQTAEALWRGVEMLTRRIETGARMQIVLYDISAEELAADLAGTDSLQDTALYSLLVEQPAADAAAGPLSFIAGLYGFDLAPPHADLLGRVAQIAAVANAPFVAAINPDGLQKPQHDWHPMVQSAWSELRALPAAAYLGLATPRFLLRMPYGKRTDPIDAFAFEEFTRQSGLSGMLWGNPALLVAQLTAKAWQQGGRSMQLGSVNVVGELPVYVYHDADGDQVALPCTERLFTERQSAQVTATGTIPVVTMRGRPEVRVAGFASLAGSLLAGPWRPVDVKLADPLSPRPPVASAAPPRQPAPQIAAPTLVAPEPAAPEPAGEPNELDALLAGLNALEPTTPGPASQSAQPPLTEAPAAAVEDDLDALLAGLSAEPPPAGPAETDADLDALLASLK